MEGSKGYVWAILAGLNAAFAAIAAKLFSYTLIRYGIVIAFNLAMWGCYVNSLKALSSLQATGTNFSANFLCSGLAGFFLFKEELSFQTMIIIYCAAVQAIGPSFMAFNSVYACLFQWFVGALLIVIGVLVLNKSSIEKKESKD